MGGRAGGGARGSGARGTSFASTYGTSGTFVTRGGEYGEYVPGQNGRMYSVGVFGNKSIGVERFKSAKEANDFVAKLKKNGFSVNQGSKVTKFKQAYSVMNKHGKIEVTTQAPDGRI